MKIADAFKVTTTRPLDALNVVSIAELAQFTEFEVNDKFPVAYADEAIRTEWRPELDYMHDMNHLDFKDARVVFVDGSTLSFRVK
jgi:hypothetical protein